MKNKTILLVEDNDDDAELTERALRKSQIKNPIVRAEDGVLALDYLHGGGHFADRDIRELPQVVLLDLNMPRMGGLEVLKRIREHPVTALLPVVVLTTSKEERDLIRAYEGRANSYMRKPVDFVEFTEAMRTLGLYWILVNEPPPDPKQAVDETS